MHSATPQTVVIIGGGFYSLKTAQQLAKRAPAGARIVLISERTNFEYHGALYRFAAGRSALEVCLPIREILNKGRVEVVYDSVTAIDASGRTVTTKDGTEFKYNYLVVGVGAETNYFGIKGLKEYSYGIKTIREAIRLKQHLYNTLATCADASGEEKRCASRVTIVGGGATGAETAGELAVYVRELAKKHGGDDSFVNIELIEAAPRLLPSLSEDLAKRVTQKLCSLGVHVYTNHSVESIDEDTIKMSDMSLETRTVIWTAGVRAHALVESIGISVDKRGRAVVDEHLRSVDEPSIFIGGDAAQTPKSGMAQTALCHGTYTAKMLVKMLRNKNFTATAMPPYKEPNPIYAIPAGPGWAAAQWGGARFYGRLGWFIRRTVDLVVFIHFLPPRKALAAFLSHYQAASKDGE